MKWLLCVLMGFVVGLLGFFGIAAFTSAVWLFSFAGILSCLTASHFVAWLLSPHAPSRNRTAAVTSAIVTVAFVTSFAGVFIPIQHDFAPDPPPAVTEYWDLPSGSRIAYLHARPTGAPRGKTILFLHGGPGTPGEGLPPGSERLTAAGFDAYAYDQVGGGRSTRLANVLEYTVARQVADLEAIRKQIGASQLILIGRSWGASLAAQYIAAHPNQVGAAVFVSPGALWPNAYGGEVADPWAKLPAANRERFEALLSSPRVVVANLLLALNPNAAHNFMGDQEADALLHTLAVAGQDAGVCPGQVSRKPHHNPQGFYVNQVTSKNFDASPDRRPALERVALPVLIIRGECDFIRSQVAEDYQRVFHGSKLVSIENAGHAVWADAPPAYRQALDEFLLTIR